MPQMPTGRQLARKPQNDAPARREDASGATPLPRDTAYFPGVSTRGVLARVLVGQIREGLNRKDVDGIRRSCALLEAIWQDVPPETRTVALELAAAAPGGAEGLARVAIREGDAELAARLPALPPFMLHDLGKLSEDVTRAICGRDDFLTAILPRLAAQPESARIAVARLYPGVMPRAVRDALLLTVRQSDSCARRGARGTRRLLHGRSRRRPHISLGRRARDATASWRAGDGAVRGAYRLAAA